MVGLVVGDLDKFDTTEYMKAVLGAEGGNTLGKGVEVVHTFTNVLEETGRGACWETDAEELEIVIKVTHGIKGSGVVSGVWSDVGKCFEGVGMGGWCGCPRGVHDISYGLLGGTKVEGLCVGWVWGDDKIKELDFLGADPDAHIGVSKVNFIQKDRA